MFGKYYLSGGLDSELVANALIDAKVEFKPVAFKWINNSGHLMNIAELEYAIKFCKDNNLNLDIMELYVENLWESTEFFDFAKDIQIQSTQQLTHAYTINLVNEKYPNSTHLFGGEVRFYIENSNDETVNVVFLDKANPPGYSGLGYYVSSPIGRAAALQLNYYGANGYYEVISEVGGLPIVTEDSGFWYTDPAPPVNYQYRISDVSITGSQPPFTVTPSASSGSFTAIPTSGQTIICKAQTPARSFSQPGCEVTVTFTIVVSSIANPAIEVTSTIEFTSVSDGGA